MTGPDDASRAGPGGGAKAALALLRERYREAMHDTLRDLDALGARLEAAPDDASVVEEVRHAVHRLHGSAGSYGFARASELAAGLEEQAMAWARDSAKDAATRGAQVRALVAALRVEFGLGPRTVGG